MTKILVIEDEKPLREEIIEWLSFEDFEVVGASDGIEGVKTAVRELPNLIICDITMPNLDGYGVLLELQSNPLTEHIPFIFLTARAAREDIRHGMSIGADDYLTKPFARTELLQAIQRQIEKKAGLQKRYQQQVDMIQQALLEEREQRLLKSRLVAMFSHDFRNPLSVIMTSNSLLRNYTDRMNPSQRATHFDRIEVSVRQLLQMLDDMLMVAQMESGRFQFMPETLDLSGYIEQILDEFRYVYAGDRFYLCDSRVEHSVDVDPRLMRQIISNLVSNGSKYSPDGSTVTVTLDIIDQNIVVGVCDQGIGIPPEDQPYLFEAFRRASNAENTPGTGLGLAIVKQAVDLHGGSITFESQLGVGTVFTVTIPLAERN